MNRLVKVGRHSDEFDDAISAGELWRQGPIGGEAPPESGNGGGTGLYESDIGTLMIEKGRYSTMMPGGYGRDPGEPNFDDYMRLNRRMGYNFQLDAAVFAESARRDDSVSVVVRGTNVGVAPFYYDWDVELALLDDSGVPFALVVTPTRLTTIQPGSAFEIAAELPLGQGVGSTHRVGLRIVQPGATARKDRAWGLEARNVYVELANEVVVLPAAWDEANALAGGWSILGTVSVEP